MSVEDVYLNLMERCLLGLINDDPPLDPWHGVVRNERGEPCQLGESPGVCTIEQGTFDLETRLQGKDWPMTAHTMLGIKRLRNVRDQLERVINAGVPGDFIETGAWRGGACILARAVLKAHRVTDRMVFVADSFQGLPPPDPRYAADNNDWHHVVSPLLAVSLDDVIKNFRRYGLLDNQVTFVKGWFKDTLPKLTAPRFAVVRLDGDMYESTMDGLRHLYPKLNVGGSLIVDDYGAVEGCKRAVHDYRGDHHIKDEIVDIDGLGVYWRKTT